MHIIKFDVGYIHSSHFIAILLLCIQSPHTHITVELLEHDGVQHRPEQLHHVVGHQHVHLLLQVPLGVQLAHVLDGELLGRHLLLVLQRLVVVLGQLEHLPHGLLVQAEDEDKLESDIISFPSTCSAAGSPAE